MRTLNQITGAVRRGEEVSEAELRMAICAYDVMTAQLNVGEHTDLLEKYFQAAEADPEEYIGWSNHPDNPEFVAWYKANINNNITSILDKARKELKRGE